MTTEAELLNQSIEAQREETYRLQQQRIRDAENALWLKHVEKIADILSDRKRNVVVSISPNTFTVDGVNCIYQVDFKEEYTSSTWRSRPTGKIRMTVGDYGERQSYRQKKDGTFSYDKAADRIEAYVIRQTKASDAQSRRNANKTVVAEFRKLANVTEYGWFGVSDDLEKPIRVKIDISRSMSVDEAFKLVEALKAIGIKPY